MKKTKIIATIGPASEDKDVLKSMINNGLNIIRINMSHAFYEEVDERIKMVRELNKELNTYTGILVDTKGPEIRTGTFIDGAVTLNKDDVIELINEDIVCDNTKVCIKYPNLYNDLKVGNTVLLNNGLVKLTVITNTNNKIMCRVENTGVIKNKRSVNLPGVKFSTPFISDKDREDIIYAIKSDADFLALSFVSSKEDVLEVREILKSHNNTHMQIISKIENQYAVNNIDEIIEVSDGIMVARGDLGVEYDMEKLPSLQKELVYKSHVAGKTCIVATEMLASMENSLRPTRAEVSDVANAVFDGTDAVMLSGETAQGIYPVETVEIMSKVAVDAEANLNLYNLFNKQDGKDNKDVTESIAYAVLEVSNILNAKAIVATTMSGYTAKKISEYRPIAPIIALTPDVNTARSLVLNYGVYPVVSEELADIDEVIKESVKISKEKLELIEDDKIIVVGGFPLSTQNKTNFMKIEEIK
jgi:pyruvate kinase